MSNLSPDPGVPQTPYKAYAATLLTAITTFVGVWIADTDPFTAKEIAGAGVTALIASGVTGVVTYRVKNKRTTV